MLVTDTAQLCLPFRTCAHAYVLQFDAGYLNSLERTEKSQFLHYDISVMHITYIYAGHGPLDCRVYILIWMDMGFEGRTDQLTW